ncbi:MAG: hypothetical protein Q9216_006792 [Gyalolechia sp. 2 TL-2023]
MSFHSRDKFVQTPSVHSLQQWRDARTTQSSTGSNTTLGTVHRTYNRQLTPNSVRSLGSVSSSPLRVQSENLSPVRVRDRGTFNSADDASLCPSPLRSSKHSSYRSSWGNDIPTPPRCRTASTLIRESGPLEDIDLNSPHDLDGQENDSDKENQEPIVGEPRLSFEVCKEEILSINEPFATSDKVPSDTPAATSPTPRTSRSFKHWLSHLRPELLKHKKTLTKSTKRWPLEESPKEQNVTGLGKVEDRRSRHKKSHSVSSTGFSGAMKAVALTRPTSTPVSRKSRRSNPFSRSNRSSRLSEDHVRLSTDHPQDSSNAPDEAALARSVQRRKTLEELLESEASYVADLKVLIHAYLTLLKSASVGSQSMSTQIHQSVTEILQLHENLLSQIRLIFKAPKVPTNSARRELPPQAKQNRQRHTEGHRITSAVVGLVHAARTSVDGTRPAPVALASPPTSIGHVAAITKIFEKSLARFFIYEEYGAQYELMLRNMALTSRSISHWQAFERSIEALANSLSTASGSEESAKKGLTFEDLLIKPIQRICKYPLLFEELYSNTSEVDDAGTRKELSELLGRLREVANEINKATNDRDTQARIQRAWRLQDLMVLPDVLVFEASQQLYEFIFCACSLSEEQAWTRAIIQYIEIASRTQRDETPPSPPIYTTLVLDAQPLGPVFGMFGSVTRRLSIQRAATVHSRANGAQVIIRNTTATKENKDDNDSIFDSVGRSKSVMTASRVPVLAPRRADRSRMESSLSDVWSRDRLPFPGMNPHRGDHPLRASASSMIRRLSRASISSTFSSKRSASTTSFVAEMKPGASVPDLQQIGEGDDDDVEHDPHLSGAYHSLRSTPAAAAGLDRNGDGGRLHGSGRCVRTGTVKGGVVRLSDATNRPVQGRDGDGPAHNRLSAQTVRIESTEAGSPRMVRMRRSVPGGLLRKGFSTETLRTWRA